MLYKSIGTVHVVYDGAHVGAHGPWACLGLPPMPLPPCLCLALSSRMLHLSVIFDIRLQSLRPARDLTGGNHFRGTFFVWTLSLLNYLVSDRRVTVVFCFSRGI